MTILSCAHAVVNIIRAQVPGVRTASVWAEDAPIPMVSECPAVRVRGNLSVDAKRLSGDCQGGYAQAIWPIEIEVFQFDNGTGYEDWMKLVDIAGAESIIQALRSNPRLKGLADVGPPGTQVLYSGQKVEIQDDPYSVTEEVPSILRHATIKYWITEIIDI